MWKASYKVGVERIDQQHYKLFELVEKLLISVKGAEFQDRKQEYIVAIAFMKAYVAEHFADEEAYQASIGYCGLEEHRRIHRVFAQNILSFEARLIASDYAVDRVKEFTGTLVSWLIYHVIREDQKIPKKVHIIKEEQEISVDKHVCVHYFGKGASEIFVQMAGITTIQMARTALNGQIAGELFVEVGLVGNLQGRAIFGFSRQLALSLIKAMTFMEMTQFDELVCSAMAEISNIISGNAATQLTKSGIACDIKPPVVSIGTYPAGRINGNTEAVFIETANGKLHVAFVKD